MIGKDEWLTDPRFATKEGMSEHVDLIEFHLQEYLKDKSMEEALAGCRARRIPVSDVRKVLDAAQSPYVKERDVHRYVDTPYGRAPVMGNPWHFSASSVSVGGPPQVGEHTREVMAQVGGFSEQQVQEFIQKGVVA